MTSDATSRSPLPPSTRADSVPVISEVPEETRLLASRIRELIEAVVHTEGSADELRDAAERIATVTAALRDNGRTSPLLLAPLDGGGQISVNNPVEGPANPLAPPMTDMVVGDGALSATATLGSAHEGAPGRAHGGWVAALLDHAVGRAVASAGLPAMTVSLTVDYRRGTPYGIPLEIAARFTAREGRKVFATAEVSAEGQVTAEASATLVVVSGLPSSAAHSEDP